MRTPLILGAALALGLTACSEKTAQHTDAALNSAGNDISAATSDAVADSKAAFNDAKEATGNALDATGNAIDNTADDAKR